MRPGIILTVRFDARRASGKVLAEVHGRPLLHWVVEQWQSCGDVIVATTDRSVDDPLAAAGTELGLEVFRGDCDDVLGRIVAAGRTYLPDYRYWMRGLGDCPFPVARFVERSVEVMERLQCDAFLWALPPWVWPAYGGREFPLSQAAWLRMDVHARDEEREHPDMYFHRHRDAFRIAYHSPPPSWYFRPHRLEIDYPEDLDMVRALVAAHGAWPSLADALAILDRHPDIAELNRSRVELTGPISSYDQEVRDLWQSLMSQADIIDWDDHLWRQPQVGKTIFCQSGQCLLGVGTKDGSLYLVDGSVIRGRAFLQCPCGAGRDWYWRDKGRRARGRLKVEG